MSKRTNSDDTAGQPRGDRRRQRVPGGRLVNGEFILNDADEGGGPSQPEVISPHGDRAQCECVHLVTIQRWDPGADAFYPRRQMMRCTTYVGDADFEYGWRCCTRCRPPWDIVEGRARNVMGLVMAGVAQLHLDPPLDPPLDPEALRLRHLRRLAHRMDRRGHVMCRCSCDSCQYRIHRDYDTTEARQRRFNDDVEHANEDIALILMGRRPPEIAVWAIPAIWNPSGGMGEEYANTVTAIVQNIEIGVLDRLGNPVQDQEGPLMVD